MRRPVFWLVFMAALLPGPARAQRVEIGPLFGVYHPMPTVRETAEGIDCDDDPCPPYVLYRVKGGTGAALGARFTLYFASRFGIDATVQRGSVVNQRGGEWGSESWTSRQTVTATFVTVQPHMRFRLDEYFEAVIAAGPMIARVNVVDIVTASVSLLESDTRVGAAVSGSLRARVAAPLTLEVRASDHVYVGGNRSPLHSSHDLLLGFGLALALHSMP